MANLTQTAANVRIRSTAPVVILTASAAVTQGMPVRPDGDKYRPAQATTAANADSRYIAITPASADGDPFVAVRSGSLVDLGATLVVGETYVVSATAAGAIAPIGDLSSTHFPTILGVATTASTLQFRPIVGGVAKA